MLSIEEAETRVADLVAAAKRAGADAADALYVCEASTQVSMRLGALEDVGRSEGEEIGLRLFVGQRSASVSSSDLSAGALAALVERAAAMAREAPEDRFAGLAPEDRLLRGSAPDLDIDDGGEDAPASLRERALAAEDAARAVPGVTNSEGAGASASRSIVALATSGGFTRGYAASSHGCSASVIAGEGGAMQRDYAYRGARHLADLEDPQAIGRRAGERAVARLNPRKLESGAMPVLFDTRVGASLIGHLLGAITGSAIARRTSFLLESLGERIFTRGVTIRAMIRTASVACARARSMARGCRPRRAISSPMACSAAGCSIPASARQLGLAPTGHAVRGIGGAPGAGAANLFMAPGAISREAMIAGVGHGILVTELIGQGVNGITGDYSRGASGFLIENGAIAGPVAEITIAGNLKDMFLALTPADDLTFVHAIDVPTIRIDGMTVAGA